MLTYFCRLPNRYIKSPRVFKRPPTLFEMIKTIVGSISRAVSMPPTIVAPNYKHPFVDGRV